MESAVLSATDLPLPLLARGKVRDMYRLPGDRLLLVATDRISAFDHVLPTPIPDKGRVLTRLSAFWFTRTAPLIPNHFLSLEISEAGPAVAIQEALRGRAMVVRRARRIDVECVVRGYLAGSAWEEYRARGTVAGVRLPPGLRPGDALPEPLFTPATKASSGHDENIIYEQLAAAVGPALAARLREASLALYRFAHEHARGCGLILADTKFEFGLLPGDTAGASAAPILIDEALTPDSSRFWDAEAHARGELVPFDKQFVRDYLSRVNWNREPPAPALPPDVVAATTARYREVYRRLTGLREEDGAWPK